MMSVEITDAFYRKPISVFLSILLWLIDCVDRDHYIESELFFENMGATGFDGITDA